MALNSNALPCFRLHAHDGPKAAHLLGCLQRPPPGATCGVTATCVAASGSELHQNIIAAAAAAIVMH